MFHSFFTHGRYDLAGVVWTQVEPYQQLNSFPVALDHAINGDDFVFARPKVHGGRPPQVAVPT